MSSLKVFRLIGQKPMELQPRQAKLEKSLQLLVESNSKTFLGVDFLVSEYTTTNGGRMDSLGIDENHCPVIIEYKRNSNENIINQGLFYLDWLLDHKADFEILVHNSELAVDFKKIDWSQPRLICIASDFTKYDVHAVKQINRNIDLITYSYHDDDIITLTHITSVTNKSVSNYSGGVSGAGAKNKVTFGKKLASSSAEIKLLFDSIVRVVDEIGDDVAKNELQDYFAFKRIKNFLCLEVQPGKNRILAYLKINPESIDLGKENCRDERGIGHFGTGDLEVTLRNHDDLNEVIPLIEKSYQNS